MVKSRIDVVLDEQQEIYNKILELYTQKGWSPPSLDEVLEIFNDHNKDQARFVFFRLYDEGKLVKISEEIFMTSEWVYKAQQQLQQFFVNNKELTVSDFREMLSTTRKYAMPLLEYFDSIKVTKRVGHHAPGVGLNIGEIYDIIT